MNTLQDLIVAISQIRGASQEDRQKQVERLIDENYNLLGIGFNDTPKNLDGFKGRVSCDQLGELGRILSILPSAQQNQTDWSQGKLGELVQRACELSIALMSHSRPEKRAVFAIDHVAQLTLCSDVRYFNEFVKLLPAEKRLSFTEASDRRVQQRFARINGVDHTYTIATNFQVINLLPVQDKPTYIANFKQLARGVNFSWADSDTKPAPKEVFQSPRADYLIDLLAIIPRESQQLLFAKQLVVSLGDRSEYRPLNLQSLERILAYLRNNQDKMEFVAYFKSQVPLFAEDLKAGREHTNPIINRVFNDRASCAFFDVDRAGCAVPRQLVEALTAERSLKMYDSVSSRRNDLLKAYIDSAEGDLDATRSAESRSLNSLESCESILFAMQDKDEHQVGWSYGDLYWLAARAAHLFVAKLSHQPEDQKLVFALRHMRNVAWTDMSYLMKAIELLPKENRLQFIVESSNLPDTELSNCVTPWSIVGVMEAVDLLPEEHKDEFIRFFKQKTNKINWDELARGRTELKSPRPEYLIGALYFIQNADDRLKFAFKLLNDVNTSDYSYTEYKKLSSQSLARILQALKGCTLAQRQEYVERFKTVVPMSVEEIQAVDAVASVRPAAVATQPIRPVQPALVVAQPTAFVARPPRPMQLVPPVAQPVARVAQPVAPVAQPAVPVVQPVAPVAQPAVPVVQPVAPVAQPAVPVVQPVAPVAQPVVRVVQPVAPVAPVAQPVVRVAQPVPHAALNPSLQSLFTYFRQFANPAAGISLTLAKTMNGNYLSFIFTTNHNSDDPIQVRAAKNWFLKSVADVVLHMDLDHSFKSDSVDIEFNSGTGYRFYLTLEQLNELLISLEFEPLESLEGHSLSRCNNLVLATLVPSLGILTSHMEAQEKQFEMFQRLKANVGLNGTEIDFSHHVEVGTADVSADVGACGVWIKLPKSYNQRHLDEARALGASVKAEKSGGLLSGGMFSTMIHWLFIPQAALLYSDNTAPRRFDSKIAPDLTRIQPRDILTPLYSSSVANVADMSA